jgi:hypothetical protein
MYLYFLDKLAQEQQGGFSIPVFESAIVQHDIHGRVERLSTFKDPSILIEQALGDQSITTLVVVGADATFFELLPYALQHKLTLGFVPLQKRSVLSTVFGLPIGIECAPILSRRLSRTIDVLRVNSGEQTQFVLGSLTLPVNAAVRMTNANGDVWSIRAKPNTATTISIENIGVIDTFGSKHKQAHNYHDGLMDIVATTQMSIKRFFGQQEREEHSQFQAASVEVESRSATSSAVADNGVNISLPCQVNVLPSAVTCIVGKDTVLLKS